MSYCCGEAVRDKVATPPGSTGKHTTPRENGVGTHGNQNENSALKPNAREYVNARKHVQAARGRESREDTDKRERGGQLGME